MDSTLSGILRLSPRRSVLALKDRFVRLIKISKLPEDKKSPAYNTAMRQLHAAILGVCALIESYPYTIERWMPELLTNILAEHTYDPVRCYYLKCRDSADSVLDTHIYNRQEMRKHLPQDASRYLARRFEEVHRGSTRRTIHLIDRIILL